MQVTIIKCICALGLLGFAAQVRAKDGQNSEPALQRAPGAGAAGQQARPQTRQQTAAELDRQAAAERAAERARQPEVAPGLRLPDESGVWALDTYKGGPELVRVRQSDGDLNLDMGHTVKPMAIPQGGARDLIGLMGDRAVVELHGRRPVFYIALDVPNEPAAPGAMVMDTHGTDRAMADRTEHSSLTSRYAVVRLRSGHGERAASAQVLKALANGGEVVGSTGVFATEQAILPGGRWMRVTTRADVEEGQYSLIELLSGNGWNIDGWDFGVSLDGPENRNALLPKEQ